MVRFITDECCDFSSFVGESFSSALHCLISLSLGGRFNRLCPNVLLPQFFCVELSPEEKLVVSFNLENGSLGWDDLGRTKIEVIA